jgi:HEAT repeat protein/type 1 glutamine amidotransferase
MKRLTTLFLMSSFILSLGAAAASAAEWQNLFNGKNLDGWIQRNGQAKYTVEDGTIVGTTVLNTPNSFLCTEKMYTDFILELEFLVQPGMNSGIQIRSNSFKHYKNYRVHGYQIEIDTSSRAWSGGIYDEARRGWLFNLKDKPEAQKAFKQNEWNHYRIEAIGDRIRTWVNGVPAADLTDEMTSTGFIALQVHGSKTADKQIKWRNIRIQDLTRAQGPQVLQALIVDGQNNHDWQGTTPVLKALLEETGMFAVDVATTPAKGQPMDSFRPEFANYDVIVSNYTGDAWPRATQEALVDYMENGGGLVIFHAADNAFPKWKEWNEMIAIGGWGGRNEKSGPMVRYRDGKMVLDHSPGRGGSHGPQHAFQLITRERHHAIMAGLPEKWMHSKDELYSTLRGPAKNMTILATAYADPAQRGTGEHEPALFTVQYGKGRVFHTVLGHAAEQCRCVGFIVTFLRGTEWAATGRVTQMEVPEDFPTADKVSQRAVISGDYDAIEDYDFGKSRQALAEIEEEMRNLPASSFGQVETRLLKALKSSRTTFAGKQFVCRMLRRVGSAKSVPTLSALLADEELSHMARFALQFMAAPEAGVALRQAVSELDGDLSIGVVGSLGQRGDREAVPVLAQLVGDRNQNLARAAIGALGRIGGAQAAEVLAGAKVPAALQPDRDDAYLMCADSLLAEGQTADALAIYRKLIAPSNGTWIRVAAYKGLIKAEKEEAVPHIIALLKDDDLDLQRAAGKFIAETPGSAVTVALAQQLPSLGTDGQIVLLSALEGRGDKAAAPHVAKAVSASDQRVRLAAIQTLGVVGGADNVTLLAQVSAAGGPLEKAARDSLARMSAPGVAAALVQVAKGRGETGARITAIETLIQRYDETANPALLDVAEDEEASVRSAAYKALGALGGQQEVPALVSLLLQADSARDRSGIERALVAIALRLESPDASPVVAALARANDATMPHLLTVLSRIGDNASLVAVRSELNNSNVDVRKAAIRALADWPDPAPLADLLNVAKSSDDTTEQILALRGYIKLLGVPANRSAAETVGYLTQAMDAARRTEEKKAVLAALPKYPCPEALALAEKAGRDASLRREAELAARRIKELVMNQALKVMASRNSGNAKNAIDGNPGTRWDTAETMRPGQWFVIDLGTENVVRGLTLDAAGSANDYPRGYEVYVSFDGGSWGRPVLTGKGAKPIVEIAFDKPVRTRFIKIVQTGSSSSWFWSIHELTVGLQ